MHINNKKFYNYENKFFYRESGSEDGQNQKR